MIKSSSRSHTSRITDARPGFNFARPVAAPAALRSPAWPVPIRAAAVEHQVFKAGCLTLGIGAVLADEQVGGAPDVELRNHSLPMPYDRRDIRE
jgi:hypothetical protein